MADPGKVAATAMLVDADQPQAKVAGAGMLVDADQPQAKVASVVILVDAYVGTERKAYCRIGRNNVFTGMVGI